MSGPAARAGAGRRRRALGLAGLWLLAAPGPAIAEGVYPERPVTLVIPFASGGFAHLVGRALGRRLAARLGQPFRMEYVVGRGGLAAFAAVAQAPADGYTLLVGASSSYAMAVHAGTPPLDVRRDLAPLGLLATVARVLCVHADSGYRSLADLVAAARAAPGLVTYGISGAGVGSHLAAELFAKGFGLRLKHRSYEGGALAAQAVARGEVQFSFLDLPTGIPLLRAGMLRPLAVSSLQRQPLLPQVRTLAESGLPGFRATSDLALFAPAGTPRPVLHRLSEAARAAMLAEETRALFAPLGIEPLAGRREDFPAYLAAESGRWLALVRQLGIQAP